MLSLEFRLCPPVSEVDGVSLAGFVEVCGAADMMAWFRWLFTWYLLGIVDYRQQDMDHGDDSKTVQVLVVV